MTVMESDLPMVKVAHGSNAEGRLGQHARFARRPADAGCPFSVQSGLRPRLAVPSAPARASVLVAGGVLRVGLCLGEAGRVS